MILWQRGGSRRNEESGAAFWIEARMMRRGGLLRSRSVSSLAEDLAWQRNQVFLFGQHRDDGAVPIWRMRMRIDVELADAQH